MNVFNYVFLLSFVCVCVCDYLIIWHKELSLIRPRPRITEVWQVRMEEGGLAEQVCLHHPWL